MQTDPPHDLLDLLDSHDLEYRVMAVEMLGEEGGEAELAILRRRMKLVNRELFALVVAISKIQRRSERRSERGKTILTS